MKKMKAYTYFVTIVFAAILVHIGTPDNVQAATKKYVFTDAQVLNIIKKKTSKNICRDFGTWMTFD